MKVLIVETSNFFCYVMVTNLKSIGFNDIEILKHPLDTDEEIFYLESVLVIANIDLNDGSVIDFIDSLKKCKPHIKVLGYTLNDINGIISHLKKVGFNGLFFKLANNKTIETAVNSINNDVFFIDSYFKNLEYKKTIIENDEDMQVTDKNIQDATKESHQLNNRKIGLVSALFYGNKNKEIAELMGISEKGVDALKKRLKESLNIEKTPDLIRYFLEKGLITDKYKMLLKPNTDNYKKLN